jgi:epsin
MEKEARQWRQIYKACNHSVSLDRPLLAHCSLSLQALQLLEYLIKHGSERVVDDARSHLSTLKMLRSFHYIDEKGKDQGINGNVTQTLKRPPPLIFFFLSPVRNRAKELVELLADVEKIRLERKKAKANRTKYVGTGNDGLSFGSGRYGGFGTESLGSYSGEYGTNASGYDRGAFLAAFFIRSSLISEYRLLGRWEQRWIPG